MKCDTKVSHWEHPHTHTHKPLLAIFNSCWVNKLSKRFSSVYVCVLLKKIKNWMCHSFREVILPVMVICHIVRCKFSRVTDSFSISRTVLKHCSRNSSSLIATTTDLKAKTQSCETEQQCSVCKCLNIYMCVKHQSWESFSMDKLLLRGHSLCYSFNEFRPCGNKLADRWGDYIPPSLHSRTVPSF